MTTYDSHLTIPDNENRKIHPYGPFKSYTWSRWDGESDYENNGIYVVNLDKPWNVIEANMSKCFGNLHAHVSRTSQDCDGSYENDYVAVASECNFNASREYVNLSKEHDGFVWEAYQPVTCEAEFRYTMLNLDEWDTDPDYRFKANPDNSDGFIRDRGTEEGYEYEDVQFCYDWSCDTGEKRFRDHSAERAGY